MDNRGRGFSLLELLMAMLITLSMGMVMFQLFQHNEKVFNDQDFVVDMQQTARAAASQIVDEIRMAGQGVPVYASTFDSVNTESGAIILGGSGPSRINIRAGLSGAECGVTSVAPVAFALGTSRTIAVSGASLFSDALGTTSPADRYVYIWGPVANSAWSWVRAELTGIAAGANTLTLTPISSGSSGRTWGANGTLGDSDDVITFTSAPTISIEEAVAFYLESGSLRRATATNMDDATNPTWGAGQEVARNVTGLTFTYYDESNASIAPNSLASRIAVARVDVRLIVRTSDPLPSTGERQTYALSTRSIPRNAKIR
jgi:hypothetical protein